MKIADRYVLNEMLWPFFGGLLAFVVMITGHMLFQTVEVMVEHRVTLATVAKYLSYQVPLALALALPVSTLLATGLGLNRLAADSEILAMRAGGMGRFRMLLPGLALGLAATIASVLLYYNLVPWSQARAEELIREVAFSRRALVVRSGKFVDAGRGWHFFVHDTTDDRLSDVRVFHQQSDYPMLFSARSARLSENALHIDRASFYLLNPQGNMTWGEQAGIDISLAEIGRAFSPQVSELGSMSLSELLAEAKRSEHKGDRTRQYLVEVQWRLALSFSCLVFALLSGGVVESFGHTQSLVGLLATLLTVFVYYVLMLWSRMLAEAAVLPVSGVWLLNIVIAVVAVIVLWRKR